MYDKLNVVDSLIPDAARFMLDNDRMPFAPLFETAEKFCAEQHVIIGGLAGVHLLLGRPLDKDFFQWDLYTDDLTNTAKALANALHTTYCPHVDTQLISVSTRIKGQEVAINVVARQLFRLFNLDRYRGVKLVDIMEPVERPGLFTGVHMLCMSPQIQLINTYRNLYNPALIGNIESEMLIEHELNEEIGIRGGGSLPDKVQLSKMVVAKLSQKYVLIGDYAISALLGCRNVHARAQFITDDIEGFSRECEQTIRNKTQLSKSIKFSTVHYQLNIPSDFRIIKYTVYMQDGQSQMPIADVFNSAEYELIPWSMLQGQKIGNPWVLMRFVLIDIYTMKLIAQLSKQRIHDRASVLEQYLVELRKYALGLMDSDPFKLFQYEDFDGISIKEDVAKNKRVKEMGSRAPNYYPAIGDRNDHNDRNDRNNRKKNNRR